MAPAPFFPLKSPPLTVSSPVPAKLIAGDAVAEIQVADSKPAVANLNVANFGVPGALLRCMVAP